MSICEIWLKITLLKLLTYLPGAIELNRIYYIQLKIAAILYLTNFLLGEPNINLNMNLKKKYY